MQSNPPQMKNDTSLAYSLEIFQWLMERAPLAHERSWLGRVAGEERVASEESPSSPQKLGTSFRLSREEYTRRKSRFEPQSEFLAKWLQEVSQQVKFSYREWPRCTCHDEPLSLAAELDSEGPASLRDFHAVFICRESTNE